MLGDYKITANQSARTIVDIQSGQHQSSDRLSFIYYACHHHCVKSVFNRHKLAGNVSNLVPRHYGRHNVKLDIMADIM